MDLSFKDLIQWSNTASGAFCLRIFLVFLIAEIFGRGLAYKVMVFFTLSKKKENAIIDLFGYFINFSAGLGMVFLLHKPGDPSHSIINGLWYIFGSMGLHIFYARYLDTWLKNKARSK